ncbi:DUF2231 domain-containing protein [Lewinella sp. JB7]|uniref:DUF2231 domain-containing protein n=1 Tax=Lewinella sp. JB7 TaxID=2962887 RepID=UPI0020C9EE06|nr:DUF2231 domain-containing protein [Lewinella sp. JB7]MCP9236322.1 hypothetical protein [Lewinella sp. JB7]
MLRTLTVTLALFFTPLLLLAQQLQESTVVHAAFSDFANLHPIVVHLPVVLLPLALLTQVASFFGWSKPLGWVTLAALAGGVAGAILAVTLTHPHTQNLNPATQQVLGLHDTYADWTLWLSVAALVAKALSLWLLPDRRWLEWIVVLLLAGTAYAVTMTGHYGGTLVYIHGVGVQGNFVEGDAETNH